VTDGTGSATKPVLVPRVGLRGILFCVGRRWQDAKRLVRTPELFEFWGRGRLTCLIPALAVANTESTASFPRTTTVTVGWAIKLTARIPRLKSWVLRLFHAINTQQI